MPQEPRSIAIGILGCGVVGSGAIRTLQENAAAIERQLGARLFVKKIAVRDVHKQRPVDVPHSVYTDDASEVLDDPEIQIIAELVGGVDPASDYLARALKNGKHVVSANKELIAKNGHQLLTAAAERNLDFFFEGAVAGGIPIIRALKVSLAANGIHEVMGIVNGTTNYILTQMAQNGLDFAVALKEAQDKGYAEADPTDDVEGFDAAYKLAILASIAFQSRVPLERVYHEGISSVTDRDIAYARDLGYVIKLVAIGKAHPEGLELRVHPAMLPLAHPLASVNDVFNAVYVEGNAVGQVMFYGRGAGSMPTGSSVAADIMEVARGIVRGGSGRVACTCFGERPVLPIEGIESNYYVRTETHDRPGVLAAIATVFGNHQVSLESILQKQANEETAEIVWITHRTREANLRAALKEIDALPVVRKIPNWLRVEE
ncbi:MAG TPA: homoserine dehydrogenase [Armatimonadota bacterium]|nr:homoserine dehydrogenase [Armatimonadota bacterium]